MFSIWSMASISCLGIFIGYLLAIATDRGLRRRQRNALLPTGSRPMAEEFFQADVNDVLIRNVSAFRFQLNHALVEFIEEASSFCPSDDRLLVAGQSFQVALNDAVIRNVATFRYELDNNMRLYLERTISDNAQLPEHQDRSAKLVGRSAAESTTMQAIDAMTPGLGGSQASDGQLKRALREPLGPPVLKRSSSRPPPAPLKAAPLKVAPPNSELCGCVKSVPGLGCDHSSAGGTDQANSNNQPPIGGAYTVAVKPPAWPSAAESEPEGVGVLEDE